MFGFLKDGISGIITKYFTKGKITKETFQEAINDIKDHLLQSDVADETADHLINEIQKKVIGQSTSTNAKDIFSTAIYNEIVNILTSENSKINILKNQPTMMLIFGNQGHGKTTTIGKLALAIKENNITDIAEKLNSPQSKNTENNGDTTTKKILLASLDIYRPAAVEQLKILAQKIKVDYLDHDKIHDKSIPNLINTISQQKDNYDIIIVDTAGRASHDEQMMNELKLIDQSFNFTERIFVVDSMLGQESIRIAKEFNNNVDITGIIMTRMDSNSHGGAVLSIKHIINKPIKFIGTGEGLNDIDVFSPKRIAGRILNQGDILALAHKVEKNIKKEEMEDVMSAMQEGRLSLYHFKLQLQQIVNPGMFDNLLSSLPGGMSGALGGLSEEKSRKQFTILQSMTKEELHDYTILNPSRKKRIANGSGVRVLEVDMTIQQFLKIKKNINKMQNLFESMGEKERGSMTEILKSKMGGGANSGMLDNIMSMFNKKNK